MSDESEQLWLRDQRHQKITRGDHAFPQLLEQIRGRINKQGGIVRDKRQLIGGGPFAPGESRSFTIIFSDPGETVAKAIPAIEPAR